jgi:UDP-glucose 4-epimerase
MAALVTGAAGFMGSHLAQELLQEGHEVIGLDDLSGGFLANVPPGVKFYQGSVLDNSLLARLFQEHRFEYVYHLAAYAAEGLSHFIRRFNYTNNVLGSMNVLNEAIKAEVKCFVFTSSIAVYGSAPPPISEEVQPRPEDPYGIAKYAVEMDLHAAHRMFSLNSVIFRPHNVYGERQHIGDRYRNVIGIFMNQCLGNEPMTIFGDGTQTRAFSYIGDVAGPMARAVRMPSAYNQTLNIGSDNVTSLNELATLVAEAMGVPRNVRYLPARQEVVHAAADHSKFTRVFGCCAQWSLTAGLGRMAEWAKQVGPRQSSVFGSIEVHKNLPPSWRI